MLNFFSDLDGLIGDFDFDFGGEIRELKLSFKLFRDKPIFLGNLVGATNGSLAICFFAVDLTFLSLGIMLNY